MTLEALARPSASQYEERERLKRLAYSGPIGRVWDALAAYRLHLGRQELKRLERGPEWAVRAALVLMQHFARQRDGRRAIASFRDYAASWVVAVANGLMGGRVGPAEVAALASIWPLEGPLLLRPGRSYRD
ncbi:MAG: hypothetical protein QM766_24110 [Burkholderiaceae bacterium]